MNTKALDLAKKLLALARKGNPGEKDNAQAILERHLKKHGLTLEEVEGSDLITLELPFYDPDPLDQNRFTIQIIGHVLGASRSDAIPSFLDLERNEKFFQVAVSCAEGVEIKAKLEFFWEDYLTQAKLFRIAYIHKNDLLVTDDRPDTDKSPMSPELASKLHKVMGVIDQQHYHKRLN